MNWTYLFTSIEGRIGRQSFWIALLIFFAVELVSYAALGERWSSIVSLMLAYPELAVLAKRGHDRNVPTWVPGLFVAGAVALDGLNLLGLLGPLTNPDWPFYVVGIPVFVLALILLVDFGLRRGTVGENRYGPDPLAAQ
jgi:uncharacterized membrane protein YhaH (DUF805 family)